MWVGITDREKCKFLRENKNGLYTIPCGLELEYNPDTVDTDVTYYRKDTCEPQILIKRGWNDRGLWEETYWKWEEKDGATSS